LRCTSSLGIYDACALWPDLIFAEEGNCGEAGPEQTKWRTCISEQVRYFRFEEARRSPSGSKRPIQRLRPLLGAHGTNYIVEILIYRRISGRLLITPATTVTIINARNNRESFKIPPLVQSQQAAPLVNPAANAAFSVNQIDSMPGWVPDSLKCGCVARGG
jgi:hypothetical protein